MASNPEIQTKVREELTEKLNKMEALDAETIQDLKFVYAHPHDLPYIPKVSC